ncbi:hypothetical protein IWX49DRAFT_164461 [Phyllosticta citricarpa]
MGVFHMALLALMARRRDGDAMGTVERDIGARQLHSLVMVPSKASEDRSLVGWLAPHPPPAIMVSLARPHERANTNSAPRPPHTNTTSTCSLSRSTVNHPLCFFFCWLLSSCLSDLLGGNRMLQSPMLLARRRSLLHTSRSESTSLPIRLLHRCFRRCTSNLARSIHEQLS